MCKDVPSQGSEFSSPEVAIGQTINAYHVEGIRECDMRILVLKLQDSLSKESGPTEQMR